MQDAFMLTGSSDEVEIIARPHSTRSMRRAKIRRRNEGLCVILIEPWTHKRWPLSASGDIVVHRKAVDYEKRQTVDRALPNLQLEWREIQRRQLSQEGQRESSQEPSGAQSTSVGNRRVDATAAGIYLALPAALVAAFRLAHALLLEELLLAL